MSDIIKYEGSLFQVVNRNKKVTVIYKENKYETNLNYEFVKRPPGVRAIIIKDNLVLLNKEYRYEMQGWDYRLPGGKIFDSQEEFKSANSKEMITKFADKRLIDELREEADIKATNYKLIEISSCGFTVDWDLYYYLVDGFEELPSFYIDDIKKNDFEYIQHCWVDFKTAIDYCLNKDISEERSSNVLLRYLLSKFYLGDNLCK